MVVSSQRGHADQNRRENTHSEDSSRKGSTMILDHETASDDHFNNSLPKYEFQAEERSLSGNQTPIHPAKNDLNESQEQCERQMLDELGQNMTKNKPLLCLPSSEESGQKSEMDAPDIWNIETVDFSQNSNQPLGTLDHVMLQAEMRGGFGKKVNAAALRSTSTTTEQGEPSAHLFKDLKTPGQQRVFVNDESGVVWCIYSQLADEADESSSEPTQGPDFNLNINNGSNSYTIKTGIKANTQFHVQGCWLILLQPQVETNGSKKVQVYDLKNYIDLELKGAMSPSKKICQLFSETLQNDLVDVRCIHNETEVYYLTSTGKVFLGLIDASTNDIKFALVAELAKEKLTERKWTRLVECNKEMIAAEYFEAESKQPKLHIQSSDQTHRDFDLPELADSFAGVVSKPGAYLMIYNVNGHHQKVAFLDSGLVRLLGPGPSRGTVRRIKEEFVLFVPDC